MIDWYFVLAIAWIAMGFGCLLGFIFGMMNGIESFREGWEE